MSTPADDFGRLPDASPFPAGFGHYDPPPVLPDPTAAPPEPAATYVSPPSSPAGPPEPPRPVGPPPQYLPPPPVVAPQPPARNVKLPIRTLFGVLLAICVLVPVLSNLRNFGPDEQVDGDTGGFDDIGGSTEPLTTAELYNEPSFTFRIDLTDRVIEGELNLIEAYDHPDCVSAAANEDRGWALAGCTGRIEAAYTGADEGLRVSQQVLMFDDQTSALTFGSLIEEQFAADVLAFEDPGDIEGSGYAASRSGVEGQYVVVTMMVSESGDEGAIAAAEDHGHARHAESLSYLIWR